MNRLTSAVGLKMRPAHLAVLIVLLGASASIQAQRSLAPVAIEASTVALDVALGSIAIRDAWAGSGEAFDQARVHCGSVEAAPDRLASALQQLRRTSEVESARVRVDSVSRRIGEWIEGCRAIDEFGESVLAAHGLARELDTGAPVMQSHLDRAAQRLAETDGPASQVYLLARQIVLLDRMRSSVRQLLAGGADSVVAQDRLARDVMLFTRMLDALITGNPELSVKAIEDVEAAKELREVRQRFATLQDSLAGLSTAYDLLMAREKIDEQGVVQSRLMEDLSALSSPLQVSGTTRRR